MSVLARDCSRLVGSRTQTPCMTTGQPPQGFSSHSPSPKNTTLQGFGWIPELKLCLCPLCLVPLCKGGHRHRPGRDLSPKGKPQCPGLPAHELFCPRAGETATPEPMLPGWRPIFLDPRGNSPAVSSGLPPWDTARMRPRREGLDLPEIYPFSATICP